MIYSQLCYFLLPLNNRFCFILEYRVVPPSGFGAIKKSRMKPLFFESYPLNAHISLNKDILRISSPENLSTTYYLPL